MRNWLFYAFMLLSPAVQANAENLHAHMADLLQYERGQLTNARKKEIITAFQQCTDAEVKNVFIRNDYFEEKSNNGQGVYVTQDSLKWNFRVKNSCYFDMDDDGQKEILFHEKDLNRGLQLSVLLKKNGTGWEVIYREYGVISGVLFEGRMLRAITAVELHHFSNPCNIFKLYKATAANGKITVTPYAKVHVPHLYHTPVRFDMPKRTVNITTDTLYFYDKILYNKTDYPYKKEMGDEFAKDNQFNSHESAWFSLVPATIYWAGFVESRGDFSSLLLAFNRSYVTDFPEYLFIYVHNSHFNL